MTMSVTVKDVEHIAALAKLSLSDEEKTRMTGQLNMVLAYMEKLKEVDTSGVEPLTSVVATEANMRTDSPVAGLTREEVLKNAPEHTEEFFKVPKTVGGGQ